MCSSDLAGPALKEVERAIEDIKKAKLDITIEGDIQDFLGEDVCPCQNAQHARL